MFGLCDTPKRKGGPFAFALGTAIFFLFMLLYVCPRTV